jgi:predicted AAA+ superfamily ATPase
MIPRAYEPLDEYVQPNKVLLIYDPRRVGKTTLLQNYLAKTALTYKLDSGDNIQTQHLLGSQDFSQILPNVYFWRTYDQQEIDIVEERDGKLIGYEGKWSTKKSVSPPSDWVRAYAEAEFTAVTPENYLSFVLPSAT